MQKLAGVEWFVSLVVEISLGVIKDAKLQLENAPVNSINMPEKQVVQIVNTC